MNDEIILDLKQFIETTVSQTFAYIATKDDLKLLATKDDIARLEKKVDEGFAGVGDAVSDINDQLANHETRITKLEAA